MSRTPVFDHRDQGTAEKRWADSFLHRDLASFDLNGVEHLVVLAAHPDDESLGAGGLLAAATRLGIDVTVLVATLGEMSHPDSPTHTADDLRRLRRAEVFAAIGVLAPTATVRLLGLPDGRLADHQRELTAHIEQVSDLRSTVIATPWIGDGHPDHAAAGAAAADASVGPGTVVLGYPIWMWHWGTPDQLPAELVRLELDAADLAAKHEALQCHRSQVEALSPAPGDEPIVPDGFAAHFGRGFEIYVVMQRSPTPATAASLSAGYFDDFYSGGTDPWGFESRWYEKRKRAITMASLPRERFRSAFEPGCSIGVLTAELAGRCDFLLSTDIAAQPLAAASDRLAGHHGVTFEQRRIPQEWPSGHFDLIVLSEIGYYCSSADLRLLAQRASSSLTPDGALLACHWRHPVQDYPLGGDEVHRVLRAEPGLALLAEHREEDFLLEVFSRPPAVSVARSSGLL